MSADPEPEAPEFPEGTTFAEVDGVPVACVPDGDWMAFDSDPPRFFPSTWVMDEGVPITREEFEALRAKTRSRRSP